MWLVNREARTEGCGGRFWASSVLLRGASLPSALLNLCGSVCLCRSPSQ